MMLSVNYRNIVVRNVGRVGPIGFLFVVNQGLVGRLDSFRFRFPSYPFSR